MDELKLLLSSYRYRFASESQLQEGIERVFLNHSIDYQREPVITQRDRPDFMVGKTVVEVKIKGTLNALLRQIARYAEHDQVDRILVVGSPHWLNGVPTTLGNKPIDFLRLTSSLL